MVLNDRSFDGDDVPSSTLSCKRAGNLLNFMQHWMYTQCYYDVALLFRYYFCGLSETDALQEVRQ